MPSDPPSREQGLAIALDLVPEPVPVLQRGTLPWHLVEQALARRDRPASLDACEPALQESIQLYRRRDEAHTRNRGRLGAVLWAAKHLGIERAAQALLVWGWPPEIPLPASYRVRRTLVEHWPEAWGPMVRRYGRERALEEAKGIEEDPGDEPDLSW